MTGGCPRPPSSPSERSRQLERDEDDRRRPEQDPDDDRRDEADDEGRARRRRAGDSGGAGCGAPPGDIVPAALAAAWAAHRVARRAGRPVADAARIPDRALEPAMRAAD